jgi:hypothetical protein
MYSILPGAIQQDLAGENAENALLRIRTAPGAKAKLVKPASGSGELEDAQLTNRRMRTFMATPSARNVNKTEDPP